jgi:hypothetical protein
LNYTTYLNIAAPATFAWLYWLHRNRERLGGGNGYATDPVCGVQIQVAHTPPPPATTHYFRSDHCQHRFSASPGQYATPGHASRAEPDPHD